MRTLNVSVLFVFLVVVDPEKALAHSFSETLLTTRAAHWFLKGIQGHYLAE